MDYGDKLPPRPRYIFTLRFDLGGGRELSLARDDRQLRHIDHAWSSTVHAAQGMTRDAAIGVLDTGHGRLTGQAALYVEASRARDRFVLVCSQSCPYSLRVHA